MNISFSSPSLHSILKSPRVLLCLSLCWSLLLFAGAVACSDDSGSSSSGSSATDTSGIVNNTANNTANNAVDTSGGGDVASDTSTDSVDTGGDTSTEPDLSECFPERRCGGECCSGYCRGETCIGICADEQICGLDDGLCCAGGEHCGDSGRTCTIDCAPDVVSCGNEVVRFCCEPGESCINERCGLDCGAGELCGDICCEAGQQCLESGVCAAQCPDTARLCGASFQLCCAEGEACLAERCTPVGADCTFTEDCQFDEYCDVTLGACVPSEGVELCEYRPEPGDFVPKMGCRWTPPSGDPLGSYDDVVMTPSVANLTDDNGDGVTNELDIPDLVFVSYDFEGTGCCNTASYIRIVSGRCNDDATDTTPATMRTIATLDMRTVDNSGGIALAELDGLDGPEIVATLPASLGTVAFRRTISDGSAWEIYWENVNYPSAVHTPGGAQPSIADLNGDGNAEVIIGNLVLNGQTGELIWDGVVTSGGLGGIGNNSFIGPVSTVADIDNDGTMEVLAGNTVYEGMTGEVRWTYDYVGDQSACFAGTRACDGYTATGNFDDDPEAEIVIVRLGEIFVLEHDGTEKYRVTVPWDNCIKSGLRANESGPPTIADFDGDGRAEVATAGGDFYVVFDFDCVGDPLPPECEATNILWSQPNEDCSSRTTGSSVFDFEGDGSAEVIYADENKFRIYRGSDGAILFEDTTHRTHTRLEMPVVVDLDNDGKSEVIIPENSWNGGIPGIDIWEDNNWVRTRRIWNQHSYHVTNINEDGTVPPYETPNWSNQRLNNFRQNVQPGGLFDAPDLIVEVVSLDLTPCEINNTADVVVTIKNQGAVGVPPGIDVAIRLIASDGTVSLIGVLKTQQSLLPGQVEVLRFSWDAQVLGDPSAYTLTATVDDDGVGAGQYNECIDDNNGAEMALPTELCGIQ